MDWFLYDRDLCHESVNPKKLFSAIQTFQEKLVFFFNVPIFISLENIRKVKVFSCFQEHETVILGRNWLLLCIFIFLPGPFPGDIFVTYFCKHHRDSIMSFSKNVSNSS